MMPPPEGGFRLGRFHLGIASSCISLPLGHPRCLVPRSLLGQPGHLCLLGETLSVDQSLEPCLEAVLEPEACRDRLVLEAGLPRATCEP